jgi:hypothetical protein
VRYSNNQLISRIHTKGDVRNVAQRKPYRGERFFGYSSEAVTKHGFADLASYYKLFDTLDKKGTERETDNERGRRKDFIERAQRDLAEADREMNSHLPK